MAEELTHQQRSLGFLAMKAWGYSQFPSIRRSSADWQLIADIAAASYNTLDADRKRIGRLLWLVGKLKDGLASNVAWEAADALVDLTEADAPKEK